MATPDGVTLARTLLDDYLRRIEEICKERRNSQDVQHAMSNPNFKTEQHRLMDRLAAEYVCNLPLIERPPFATIEVGTFKTVADLRQTLVASNFRIGNWASDLLDRPEFTLLTEPAKLDLYMASNAELGYPNGCTVAQSFEALEKIGAVKLPPEAGAQYRLRYADQPLNEWRLMYMDPIADSIGCLEVLAVVRNDGGLWLYGDYASPSYFYVGGGVWVFARK